MGFEPPLTVAEIAAAFDGKFVVHAELAAGGQGAVFRATTFGSSGSPGAVVALKIYFDSQVEERAAREIEAMRRLRGPTLSRLHDSGQCLVRGQPCSFIATTFIEGTTLMDLVRKTPLPLAAVARIGSDVAFAIEELWEHRIVHRDIKPGNIMLSKGGRAVLIDLGVARHLSLDSLTTFGKTWGTEGYLSPEQMAAQRALTCKSDVFALGVVMQESLLGRHPTGRRQQLLANGGISTERLVPGLPLNVCALIDAMLHRSPVRRPLPSVIAHALSPFLGGM